MTRCKQPIDILHPNSPLDERYLLSEPLQSSYSFCANASNTHISSSQYSCFSTRDHRCFSICTREMVAKTEHSSRVPWMITVTLTTRRTQATQWSTTEDTCWRDTTSGSWKTPYPVLLHMPTHNKVQPSQLLGQVLLPTKQSAPHPQTRRLHFVSRTQQHRLLGQTNSTKLWSIGEILTILKRHHSDSVTNAPDLIKPIAKRRRKNETHHIY